MFPNEVTLSQLTQLATIISIFGMIVSVSTILTVIAVLVVHFPQLRLVSQATQDHGLLHVLLFPGTGTLLSGKDIGMQHAARRATQASARLGRRERTESSSRPHREGEGTPSGIDPLCAPVHSRRRRRPHPSSGYAR
jgi:hypothetical protein